MADATAEFFRELADRRRDPLLGRVNGRVRFDLVDGDAAQHWLVTITGGEVSVARERAAADCTIRTEKALFERLIRGEENATAAVLRGAILCSGDAELLLAIQRIFPGPPHQKGTTEEVTVSR